HTVYEGELTGINLALDLIATEDLSQRTRFTVLVDNTSSLRALPRRAARPGQHLVELFHERLDVLRASRPYGLTLHFNWAPGHCDVAGNEAADKLARGAAEGLTSPLPRALDGLRNLPRSAAAARQAYK
ncbi:hypothetical protein K523DRAFT_217599, partial [Schizophyllum commune Tattone D]